MPLLLSLLLAAPAPLELTVAPSCSRFLPGKWAGKGEVTGFGPPTKVDNAYTFNGNGQFLTINRYQGKSGKWTEQRLTGRWATTPAKGKRECTLELKGTGTSAGSTSSSTFTMIDQNTFRSLGFDMKRVK